MARRLAAFLSTLASLLLAPAVAEAQAATTPAPADSTPRKLAFLIPSLLDQHLQSVDPVVRPLLQQVLGPGVAAALPSLNASVVTHLSTLPLSSPAAAPFIAPDDQLGARTSYESTGPILTERSETLGAGRFVLALTHQRFEFDRSDGLNLRDFRVTLPLQVPLGPGVEVPGLVDTRTYIGINIAQTTGYLVYGLTDHLDVTLATPIVTTSLTLRSQATVNVPALSLDVATPVQWLQASATGIGDQVVRVKQRLTDNDILFAVAVDVRLPTGDEYDFHGAGSWGIRGFGIASTTFGRISPHLNAGYEWNGASILASESGLDPEQLPDRVFINGGFDAVVSDRFTVAFDLMQQILPETLRTRLADAIDPGGQSVRTLTSLRERQYQGSLSAGFKVRLAERLIVTANALVRLNETGLRARVVPTLSATLSPAREPRNTPAADARVTR